MQDPNIEGHEQHSFNATSASASVSAPKKKGSLQALYATEVVTPDFAPSLPITRSLYPDVPSIARRGNDSNNLTPSMRSAGYRSEETESLLGSSSTALPNQPITNDGPINMPTTLVNELLQENSRLTEEVEQLKRLLSVQNNQVSNTMLIQILFHLNII